MRDERGWTMSFRRILYIIFMLPFFIGSGAANAQSTESMRSAFAHHFALAYKHTKCSNIGCRSPKIAASCLVLHHGQDDITFNIALQEEHPKCWAHVAKNASSICPLVVKLFNQHNKVLSVQKCLDLVEKGKAALQPCYEVICATTQGAMSCLLTADHKPSNSLPYDHVKKAYPKCWEQISKNAPQICASLEKNKDLFASKRFSVDACVKRLTN